MARNVKILKEVTNALVLVNGSLENTVMKVKKRYTDEYLLYQVNLRIRY